MVATKDGYSTCCKKCACKGRCKNLLNVAKLDFNYDKTEYKWCPGPTHETNEERIIIKLNFHSNKNSHDNLATYCKECIGQIKYGKNRKRKTISKNAAFRY